MTGVLVRLRGVVAKAKEDQEPRSAWSSSVSTDERLFLIVQHFDLDG
jgi:hypothetical protein